MVSSFTRITFPVIPADAKGEPVSADPNRRK
jgi:hypothetical protein